jgi:hypothetical protein
VNELLARAFAALGPNPTDRELALVADAVRSSGDAAATAALEAPLDDDELDAVATASGASGFTALDLKTVFCAGAEAPTRQEPPEPD